MLARPLSNFNRYCYIIVIKSMPTTVLLLVSIADLIACHKEISWGRSQRCSSQTVLVRHLFVITVYEYIHVGGPVVETTPGSFTSPLDLILLQPVELLPMCKSPAIFPFISQQTEASLSNLSLASLLALSFIFVPWP